ncbi:MAG: Rrf2 family transcriptional regulator [Elusimicrobiota bacterium]
MKISFKGDYALKTILDLSLHYGQGVVLARDIAKRQDIPLKYLEQILLTLKGAGYVQSKRGPAGGYLLTKLPEQITIGEIVRLMEGPTSPITCVSSSGYAKCSDEHLCPFRSMWVEVKDAINEIVDKTTFKDICAKAKIDSNNVLMYNI